MLAAVCISGAISKLSGRFLTIDSVYENKPYINYNICFNSIKKHILEANQDYNFDFFIHSWNPDLKNNIIALYNPKKYLFEYQYPYFNEINIKSISIDDFGGIAKSISIKKSIELLQEYELEQKIFYDKVIVYRPDVILIKDINLDLYDNDKIYVNKHGNSQGDFHFIMNTDFANKFKYLYDSINKGNKHRTHFWIKKYINDFMNQELFEDDIVAGIDQEVIRKIQDNTNNNIQYDKLVKEYNGN